MKNKPQITQMPQMKHKICAYLWIKLMELYEIT